MPPIPNPFEKKKDQPISGAPPVGLEAAEPDPAGSQRKKLLIGSIIAVVILVLFAVVPVVYLQINKSKKAANPTSSLSITPRPPVDPKATSTLGPQRLFLERTATQKIPYDLTYTVPTAWNTKFSTTPSNDLRWNDSVLAVAMISGYSPLSSANINIPVNNYVALIDITNWLASKNNPVPMTPAQKQQWFATLNSVTPENAARVSAAAINPRIAKEDGGRQHLQAVAVADNTLKGISYITNQSNTDYTPTIVIMLVGSYQGRSYVLYGQHAIRDQSWASISALKARNDSGSSAQIAATTANFAAGTIGTDTVEIHTEFLTAIQTMQLKQVE
jgi:hypothetical protein